MSRSLSHTEVSAALTCQARWDYRYGGHLAGTALRPREVVPPLQAGRAFGAGVQAYHLHHAKGWDRYRPAALVAVVESLKRDALGQIEAGFHDRQAHADLEERLLLTLTHYMDTTDPIPLEGVELPLDVPIPSRTGVRPSARYRFEAHIDGVAGSVRASAFNRTHEPIGEPITLGTVLLEIKLRTRLTPVQVLQSSSQLRWYAWAYWRATGERPTLMIVEERLFEAPKPPRILQSGKVSEAVDQVTTPEWYEAVCRERDQEPAGRVLEALRARTWQQRVPLTFRADELEQAGQELVSAAKLIGQLDRGELQPIRNAMPMHCSYCDFKACCADPDSYPFDSPHSAYEKTTPKREKERR